MKVDQPQMSLLLYGGDENLICTFIHRGRFGQVHKCVENSSGLTLAAKIIKARTQKEKVSFVFLLVTESSHDHKHDHMWPHM